MGRQNKNIGLHPSDTGLPAGKETGQKVTHYIIPGGPYAKAYAKLKTTGLHLDWQSTPAGKDGKAKMASKTKFTCPQYKQNAWAKPDAMLLCGLCNEDGNGEVMLMLSRPRNNGANAASRNSANPWLPALV